MKPKIANRVNYPMKDGTFSFHEHPGKVEKEEQYFIARADAVHQWFQNTTSRKKIYLSNQ